MDQTLIKVFAGHRPDGSHCLETLWVEGRSDGSYRLIRTPKLVLGLAREDVFRVDELANVHYVRSGGYYAFHVVLEEPFTPESLAELIRLSRAFGGTLDVHDDIIAGLAVPQSADFEEFMKTMEHYLQRHVGRYWNASASPPEIRDRAQ